jgi:hypothetical protein
VLVKRMVAVDMTLLAVLVGATHSVQTVDSLTKTDVLTTVAVETYFVESP